MRTDLSADIDLWWDGWHLEDYSWSALAALDERGIPKKPWRGFSVEDEQLLVPTRDAKGDARLANLQDYWRIVDDGNELKSDEELRRLGHIDTYKGVDYHVAHIPEKDHSKFEKFSSLRSIITRKIERSNGRRPNGYNYNGIYNEEDGRAQLNGAVIDYIPILPGNNINVSAEKCFFSSRLHFGAKSFGPEATFRRSFLSRGFAAYGSAHGDLNLNGVISAADIVLAGCKVSGALSMAHVKVFGGIDAQNTSSQNLDMGRAWVSDKLWLQRHTCRGRADLYWMDVGGNLDLEGFESGGPTFLSSSSIKGITVLSGAEFKGSAKFDSVRFYERVVSKGSWRWLNRNPRTRFRSGCSFENSVFYEQAELTGFRWRDVYDNAFLHAEFHKALVWPWRQTHAYAALASVKLHGGINFHSFGERHDHRIFEERALPIAITRGRRGLEALRSGLRTLRNYYSATNDRAREAQMYRFELMALSADKATSFGERLSEKAFRMLSKHGFSISRPLITLALLAVPMSFVYVVLELTLQPIAYGPIGFELGGALHPAFKSALELSFQNSIGPLPYLFSEQVLDDQKNQSSSLFYRILLGGFSLAHQVVATALIFLSALAARRKFQLGS